MQTPEEIIASGRAVLALDTNAVIGFRRLQNLCNLVNLLRSPPEPLDYRIYVPSVVHMEVLFDLRQLRGASYEPREVVQGLLDKGLEIQPFGEQHAEHAAARLGESFPTSADWHAAKRTRCIQCLGLNERSVSISGSGKSCGATIDLVIAAHAAYEGWILVTNDRGPDFAGLTLKIKLDQLEKILEEIVGRRSGRASEAP